MNATIATHKRNTAMNRSLLIAMIAALPMIAHSEGSSKKFEESVLLDTEIADASVDIAHVLLLSEKMGEIGLEAVGMGIPVVREKIFADWPGDKMYYVDVDTLEPSEYQAAFDLLRQGLVRGSPIVLETSQFNLKKLQHIVSVEFPEVDLTTVDDVNILLQIDAGKVMSKAVDPSEMAMYAGVPHSRTTDYKYSRLVSKLRPNEEISENPNKWGGSLTLFSKTVLPFAALAYTSSPATYSGYSLVMNYTEVDVWAKPLHARTTDKRCIVAWRGTNNLTDVYADLRSQISYSNQLIPNAQNAIMRGGRGFVNRVSAFYEVVFDRLVEQRCAEVYITGHSLGGAAAQINALQMVYDNAMRSRFHGVGVFNSPNVVDEFTLGRPLTVLRANGIVDVNCRYHDWLVNPLPSGLHRLGSADSEKVSRCTYVREDSKWSPFPTTNHSLTWWFNEAGIDDPR